MSRFLDRIFRRHAPEAQPSTMPAAEEAEFASLIQELAALGELEPPAGAEDRTWFEVRREARTLTAERRVATSPSAAPSRFRWAVVPAVVAALLLAVVAIAQIDSGDVDIVESTSTTTQVVVGSSTSVPTMPPSTLQPPISRPAGSSTTVAPATSTTGARASGTTARTTTVTTHRATTSTVVAPRTTKPTSTTQATTPTTKPATTTTKPVTTTTSPQVYTREQRMDKATSAARYVARQVVNGDPGGAAAVVADGAGLNLLVRSLHDPVSYSVSARGVSGDTVSVNVSFVDRIADGSGGVAEKTVRFLFRVRSTGDGSAVVTSISFRP